jgi:hypothetical protein
MNVFKNNIACSIMDTLALRVPTKQIGDFSTFDISNVSRLGAPARTVIAANNICKFLDVFNKYNISLEDTFCFA